MKFDTNEANTAFLSQSTSGFGLRTKSNMPVDTAVLPNISSNTVEFLYREMESKREDLVTNNKALGERHQLLSTELANIEKQVHMVNGALNILDVLMKKTDNVKE